MDAVGKTSALKVSAGTSSKRSDGSELGPQHIVAQAGYQGTIDQALEKTLKWLQENNDTSRLAGLTLLKPLLENNAQLREQKVIEKCWKAIPIKFLIRLLRSTATEKTTQEEASNYIGIAVGVLHSFVCILSTSGACHDPRLIAIIQPLLALLPESSNEIQCHIGEILIGLSTGESAFVTLWQPKNWTTLVDISLGTRPALILIKHICLLAADLRCDDYDARVHQTIMKLVSRARISNEISDVFEFCDAVLSYNAFLAGRGGAGLDEITSPRNCRQPPHWLPILTSLIHKTVLYADEESSNTAEACSAVGSLIATLLDNYRASFPSLLFCSTANEARLTFINHVIVEIRSAMPSLQELLHMPQYTIRSSQLVACYDVLSNFIGFLISTLDSDVEDGSLTPTIPALQDPSTLLRLRRDISETMSLTIEHLRERFDASNAGAKGLHPDSRARDPSSSITTPLSLTLEESTSMSKDPLTVAEINTLSLWLRDDDNDALRNEAAGLMDLFTHLYNQKDRESAETDDTKHDVSNDDKQHQHSFSHMYKNAIPVTLSGILQTPIGVESFLAEGGWEAMAATLDLASKEGTLKDEYEGAEVARLLTTVVEGDFTGPSKEQWMPLIQVSIAAAQNAISRPTDQRDDGTLVDLSIATGQLAVALYEKAPAALKRRYKHSIDRLRHLTDVAAEAQAVRFGGPLDDSEDLKRALRNVH